MRKAFMAAAAVLALALSAHAQAAPDAAELTRLLTEFLEGAGRNDAAVHERFWAEDLVYTGSTGRRVGKADIMRDVRAAPPAKPGDPSTTYGAEDVRIRQYGDAAVVAFRLVASTARGATTDVSRYFNTGTFLKRGGRWQVVSWQATRVPRPEEELREESRAGVTAAEAAFRRAATAADAKALETLTEESFVWTRGAGEPLTRRQMLDAASAGLLRFVNREPREVSVNVYGDAAVWRAATLEPRGGGGEPVRVFYTMTFVNRGGWKAVSLHTSVP